MSKLNLKYLSGTFFIMLICWGTCLVCSLNNIFLNENIPLFILYVIGGLSPAFGSYYSMKKEGKINNVKKWFKEMFDFKHNIVSYLLVFLFGLIYVIPQCIISEFTQNGPLYAIITAFPIMLIGGGFEETGWRHILQVELEKKYNLVISTVIVSIIWWIWHLPLLFIPGVALYGKGLVSFYICILGLSFALATIKKTTKSTWLCILFHCFYNCLTGVFVINTEIKGSFVACLLLCITSCIVLKFNEKKSLLK